jgi:hypothetical protein
MDILGTISRALLPDSLVLQITEWVHDFEEWSMPMPSASTVMWTTLVGIPVVLAAHDSSHVWMPDKFQVPVVSWFQRRWKRSEKLKARDVHMMRDAVVFAYVAASLYEGNARTIPLDYVADRLINASARTILTREMQSKRGSVFAAGQQVLSVGADDAEKVAQMKTTAMRRRAVQENMQL